MLFKYFVIYILVSILFGMGIYVGFIYFLKVEEVGLIVKMVREKFGI